MLVTAIVPQKRRRDRLNIFLDGTFAFSLNAEILVKHRVKLDATLDKETIDKLIKENELSLGYNLALQFLSFRPRSRKEITDYLHKKEIGDKTHELIMEKLERAGFVDDEKFARWFVEQRQTFRPKGKRLLTLEMKQKGIPREIIEKVLSEEIDAFEEEDKAYTLVRNKIHLWQKLPSLTRRLKIQAFLARRGYSWDTVAKILKRMKEETV